jgi:hypothetical protein
MVRPKQKTAGAEAQVLYLRFCGTTEQLGEKLWVFAAVAPSRVFSAALWAGYGVPVHLFRPFFAAGRDTSPAQTWA